MQEMVANEVNDRMGRAVGELKDKYEKGGKGYDAASDAQVRGRDAGTPHPTREGGSEGHTPSVASCAASLASRYRPPHPLSPCVDPTAVCQ